MVNKAVLYRLVLLLPWLVLGGLFFVLASRLGLEATLLGVAIFFVTVIAMLSAILEVLYPRATEKNPDGDMETEFIYRHGGKCPDDE